jgi:hypothetical protein
MTTASPSEISSDFRSIFDSNMRFAETQWRALGDLGNVGAFYQMGFDAWRHWTELQLSLWDTCWKMSSLPLDLLAPGAQRDAVEHHIEASRARMKKIAAH